MPHPLRPLVLLAAYALAACAAAAAEPRRPNIVLILVDDFGYECVGANGGTSYRTPVMDKLAATGVRFDSCFAQAACTPREWYSCWYGPTDTVIAEFAVTRDFKLSRTGEFFDLRADIEEKQPLKVAALKGEAATVAKLLHGALDRYRDARPTALAKPFSGAKVGGKKAGKQIEKAIDDANKQDEEI